jgi:rod shape-determining protein MreC
VSLRDNPLGEIKVPLAWTAAVALVVAGVVAVAFLATDRRGVFQAEAYGVSRKAADAVAAPVGGVLAGPIRWTGAGVDYVKGYFFAVSENRRLKAELKEARQWRDTALALKHINERYRVMLGMKTDPPIPMVSARIVADARGPFANTRLADVGDEKGIKPGYPVMSENGLVGRIIGVTTGASRVLLLTDVASRTPVMIDRTNARAILAGDGGPNPKLDYMRGTNPVREGDRVVTSGDGGVLPRGLPVGVAAKGLDGRWRVVLSSDAAPIDYVRILKFQDFSQLVNYKALEKMPVPPPSTTQVDVIGVTPTPSPAAPTAATPRTVARPARPAASSAAPGSAAPRPAAPAAAAPRPATTSAPRPMVSAPKLAPPAPRPTPVVIKPAPAPPKPAVSAAKAAPAVPKPAPSLPRPAASIPKAASATPKAAAAAPKPALITPRPTAADRPTSVPSRPPPASAPEASAAGGAR